MLRFERKVCAVVRDCFGACAPRNDDERQFAPSSSLRAITCA
jgi:hypothetical protein